MRIAVGLLAVVAALLLVDRLALWAEDHGWIYWRKRKPEPTSAGSALLEVQALFEPQKIHVVEERRNEHVCREDDGDPPVAGTAGKDAAAEVSSTEAQPRSSSSR